MSKQSQGVNYLTQQNGCSIVDFSSERERGPVTSIISSDPKSVWVTSGDLPQTCTISLKKIIKKPAFYNTIGFYCWHQYDSNPALIELYAKMGNSDRFVLISKTRLALVDTWQYFKIQDISAEKLKELQIRIIENFGDSKTYLNRISLHKAGRQDEPKIQHDQIIPKIPKQNTTSRDKTYSEYHKSDQIHLQLKKALQRIHALEEEQQRTNRKMLQQQKVMIKTHQLVKALANSLQAMQNTQQMSRCVQDLTPSNNKKKVYRQNQDQQSKCKHLRYRRSQAQVDQNKKEQIEELKRMINALQKKSTGQKPKYNSGVDRMDRQSRTTSHKISRMERIHQQKYQQYQTNQASDVIKTNSEEQLSQYSHPHYKTSQVREHNKLSKKQMLGRLQLLVDKKKKLQLKRSQAQSGSKMKKQEYQQNNSDDQQYYQDDIKYY